MEKLPEDFKRKWVEALRSGEYVRGHGYLYDELDGTFCCLGVAGVINGIPLDEMNHQSAMIMPVYQAVCPTLSHDMRKRLAEMNDNGKSFLEIASYIEQNL